MKPEQFTDDQLRLAILDASDQRNIFISKANYLEDIGSLAIQSLRTLLAHLPEPATDEWQECGANDLQSGDVYRAESVDANVAYKQPITQCAIVGDWVEVQHVGGMKSSARISSNTFYRIPAPVQRPDPEVNHFIRINGKDYEAIPDSGRYQLIESKWSSPMVLNVEHITEWEELELIPKVVEDDR